MSLFDKNVVENEESYKKKIAKEEAISLCVGPGAHIVETEDVESFLSYLLEVLSPDYSTLGGGEFAAKLKNNHGRPVIMWDAKGFKRKDAVGSMYRISKLAKDPKPIIIIKNITDIPEATSDIFDDPEHVENVLLHSWKNDTINLTFNQESFQLNSSDYSVILPVGPGWLEKLHHRPFGMAVMRF